MSYQTTRFADLFTQLATKNKAGSFHVTLGDPSFDRSFEIICTLVENGADALEQFSVFRSAT